MYPKQLNPGVEMGAEVSLRWGSATAQGPSPSEAGRAWTLASWSRSGRTFLSPWLSLHCPLGGHPGEPLDFPGQA